MTENKFVPWTMHSYTHFSKEVDGYIIDIQAGNPSRWWVMKDGQVIDDCYRYSPMNGEGNAKVQSEKVLASIIAKNKITNE